MHAADHRLAHLAVPGDPERVHCPDHAKPADGNLGHRHLSAMESFYPGGRVLRGELSRGYLAKNVLHVLIICHERFIRSGY
jgi:hypothetical protein